MLTSLFVGRQELAQYATSAINQTDYQAYRQLTSSRFVWSTIGSKPLSSRQ
ncbi:hypothetical protein QWZ13_09655 [Reinekea marina]|uniref:hypothetical protein n=1 Tax=Reinekea marina TaxID=1310421 RepID=UPI0025B5DCF8|nr:hypothetical protein [Reinekea marina]MDN3649175.1 hypothetical protein [Reinekea marina]